MLPPSKIINHVGEGFIAQSHACVRGADGDNIAADGDRVRSDQIDRRAPGLERDGGDPGTASAAHRSPVVFRKQVIEVPRGAVGFALVHPEDAAVLGHATLWEGHGHIQASAVAHRANVRYLEPTVGPKQVFSEEGGIDAVARRLGMAGAVVAAVGHDIGAQIGDNGGGAGHIVSHPIVGSQAG